MDGGELEGQMVIVSLYESPTFIILQTEIQQYIKSLNLKHFNVILFSFQVTTINSHEDVRQSEINASDVSARGFMVASKVLAFDKALEGSGQK